MLYFLVGGAIYSAYKYFKLKIFLQGLWKLTIELAEFCLALEVLSRAGYVGFYLLQN